MKIKSLIFIASFGCLLPASCEKDAFDYRNKYVGDWQFEVEATSFNMMDSSYSDTTFTYNGTIKYGDRAEDIVIHYAQNTFQTLKLSENGELSDFPTPYSGGQFEGADKLHLYFYFGGHGGGSSNTVNGIRN